MAKDTKKPTAKTAPVKVAAAKPAPAKSAKPAAAKPAAAKPAASRPAASASASRPWLAHYPKDVPAEIPPSQFASVGELLVASSRKFSSRPAFTMMGKSMSFAEADRLSAAVGGYLQSRGLARGARVAIMMPNVLQYPITVMGALRAGYTVVNVNPLYTPRELEHQLKDSGAEAIVILENFATTLQAVLSRTAVKHVIVASMGDLLGLKGHLVNLVVRRVKKMVPAWSLPGHVKFKAALSAGASAGLKEGGSGPNDVAFLQYTGGTTGVSKGATLLNRNVLANVAQAAIWVEDAYTIRPKPTDLTYLCALPLYHIFALTVNMVMGMQQGANNILIPNPRDIPGLVGEMKAHTIHIFPGLNTLFNGLLNNEDFRKLDFSKFVLALGGGMAVQRPVAERWKEVTGVNIAEGYGLSETSPIATANKFSAQEFSGTIGLPVPSTEISIRDDDGKEVPLGEVGEICIRGPQVMAGYWNRPDETAKVMTSDNFFKSGDMGFMDERGYTKIVDRKKDMILVSGFNVYPNEIEEVMARHPGVLEAAAIGVPDDKSGETPKLFIVRKDPNLTKEQVADFCKENLTGYKRPKYIEFRDALPKSNVGKILRRELRD
ncbi:MAG: long-chain-fatty-acid--CoA ligase [Rhizobiaceae bacterium]